VVWGGGGGGGVFFFFFFLHFLAQCSVMSTPFAFALSLWFLHFAAETKKYWVYNFRQ